MTDPAGPLQPPFHPAEDDLLARLRTGALALDGLMPWSSNYTFLAHIEDSGATPIHAIYKPIRGEQPLWDFPRGTLARRETASYLVSRALGWNLVPPTVFRRGPHGRGSVQLFVNVNQDAHFFTFRADPAYAPALRALTLFDVISNNADRKGGHCLAAGDGRIIAIDHGLCFHEEPKLRTVVWDFAGQPIETGLADDVQRLHAQLGAGSAVEAVGGELVAALADLLSGAEIGALKQRVGQLLELGCFPDPPTDRRPYPWPLV